MAVISRNVPRGCAAIGCFEVIPHERFMCERHRELIPESNREELRQTFLTSKTSASARRPYLAARIRAIIAVAAIEEQAAPQSLHNILKAIDSGDWSHVQPA